MTSLRLFVIIEEFRQRVYKNNSLYDVYNFTGTGFNALFTAADRADPVDNLS